MTSEGRRGERHLPTLLTGLRPQSRAGRYVFTHSGGGVPEGVHPVVTVAEAGGLTLVVAGEADQAGLPYDYVAGWITLRVHSALEPTG